MGKDKLTEVDVQDLDAGNKKNITCDDSTREREHSNIAIYFLAW